MAGIKELVDSVHENAVEHGWWDEDRPFTEVVALIHSEISEALEEYRGGHGETEIFFGEGGKPEGIPVEMADAVIQIMDWCGRKGVDLESVILRKHEYNRDRPYRHGQSC